MTPSIRDDPSLRLLVLGMTAGGDTVRTAVLTDVRHTLAVTSYPSRMSYQFLQRQQYAILQMMFWLKTAA